MMENRVQNCYTLTIEKLKANLEPQPSLRFTEDSNLLPKSVLVGKLFTESNYC